MDNSSSRHLRGGSLWINLANTIHMRDGRAADALEHPEVELEWLRDNGLWDANIRASSPDPAAEIHAALLGLRDVCIAVLSDLDREGALSETTFGRMRAKAEAIGVELRAERDEDGRVSLTPRGQSAGDAVAFPIAQSLFDTLANVPLERIRACEHEACILHFVDTSKAGKRRWCSMESCGNRHKATEFYAKRKLRRST